MIRMRGGESHIEFLPGLKFQGKGERASERVRDKAERRSGFSLLHSSVTRSYHNRRRSGERERARSLQHKRLFRRRLFCVRVAISPIFSCFFRTDFSGIRVICSSICGTCEYLRTSGFPLFPQLALLLHQLCFIPPGVFPPLIPLLAILLRFLNLSLFFPLSSTFFPQPPSFKVRMLSLLSFCSHSSSDSPIHCSTYIRGLRARTGSAVFIVGSSDP